MNLKKYVISCLLLGLSAFPAADNTEAAAAQYSLDLDSGSYILRTAQVEGREIKYRAYENRVYAAHPVDAVYESMNIYVPEEYFAGRDVNGYSASTAPIFLPNTVGGYMPGKAGAPGDDRRHGGADAALMALADGCVVAEPGVRGRTLKDAHGDYSGKAPACIVDLKAAVRYLRHNKGVIPGDTEKIISNGTSAGGALSALLGSDGNSADYAPYLQEIGAADERDDIYAVSSYCPVTDLEHADMAYEWLFASQTSYRPHQLPKLPQAAEKIGRKPAAIGAVAGTSVVLTPSQLEVAADIKAQFAKYVNSLELTLPDDQPLTLEADGSGSFSDYVAALLAASAQTALDAGQDLSGFGWVAYADGKVTGIDIAGYAVWVGRQKPVGAFDDAALTTPENSLFGTAKRDAQHFTAYFQHQGDTSDVADETIVALMNPMHYIGASTADTATYWRIRQGVKDNDVSLAVPALLASRLIDAGNSVDIAYAWDKDHDGDYDLPALMAWIDRICKDGSQ